MSSATLITPHMYIKSKCGHSILLDMVNCRTHCILGICLVLLFQAFYSIFAGINLWYHKI